MDTHGFRNKERKQVSNWCPASCASPHNFVHALNTCGVFDALENPNKLIMHS